MKYAEFRRLMGPASYFKTADLALLPTKLHQSQLARWVQENKIIKIRRGVYLFQDVTITPDLIMRLSNILYEPSYVSLTYALRFYELIPDTPWTITAVSSQKTTTFNTPLNVYKYQTIQPKMMWGYTQVQGKAVSFQIASIGKALLDLLYLNPDLNSEAAIQAMRLDYEAIIDQVSFEKIREKALLTYPQSCVQRFSLLKEVVYAAI